MRNDKQDARVTSKPCLLFNGPVCVYLNLIRGPCFPYLNLGERILLDWCSKSSKSSKTAAPRTRHNHSHTVCSIKPSYGLNLAFSSLLSFQASQWYRSLILNSFTHLAPLSNIKLFFVWWTCDVLCATRSWGFKLCCKCRCWCCLNTLFVRALQRCTCSLNDDRMFFKPLILIRLFARLQIMSNKK